MTSKESDCHVFGVAFCQKSNATQTCFHCCSRPSAVSPNGLSRAIQHPFFGISRSTSEKAGPSAATRNSASELSRFLFVRSDEPHSARSSSSSGSSPTATQYSGGWPRPAAVQGASPVVSATAIRATDRLRFFRMFSHRTLQPILECAKLRRNQGSVEQKPATSFVTYQGPAGAVRAQARLDASCCWPQSSGPFAFSRRADIIGPATVAETGHQPSYAAAPLESPNGMPAQSARCQPLGNGGPDGQ